jgi:hypothetical protein
MARASRRLSKAFGDKSLEDVSDAEIRALVSNNVAERQYLDFKAEFDHKLPDAKPKLLRHVASFANGGGGYLILGIRDDGHGRAQRFEGLQGNVESIVKRIRSLCLKYLDPRISGLELLAMRTIFLDWWLNEWRARGGKVVEGIGHIVGAICGTPLR